jgi:hypothetical protein
MTEQAFELWYRSAQRRSWSGVRIFSFGTEWRKGWVDTRGLEEERVDDRDAVVTNPNRSVAHTHENDMVKHGSFFARVGSKHGDVSEEQATNEV